MKFENLQPVFRSVPVRERLRTASLADQIAHDRALTMLRRREDFRIGKTLAAKRDIGRIDNEQKLSIGYNRLVTDTFRDAA